MKHIKASFITAGAATLLITANAVGAVYAFNSTDGVPSYQSTAPPVASAAPTVYGAVSEEAAVATAKDMIESTYNVKINDFYSTVTVQTTHDETPAWYVSFIRNYTDVQSPEYELVKCYSVYIDSETAKILGSTEDIVTESPSTKIQLVGEDSEVAITFAEDIVEYTQQ